MNIISDFNYINTLCDNFKITNFEWYQVHLFLRNYKDDINNQFYIITILTKSITLYLYKLKTSGYDLCMYDNCRIFMNWLGYPNYYTPQMIDFMIYSCMKNTQSICSGKVCRNNSCIVVHMNHLSRQINIF